jgi:hypothetical protein
MPKGKAFWKEKNKMMQTQEQVDYILEKADHRNLQAGLDYLWLKNGKVNSARVQAADMNGFYISSGTGSILDLYDYVFFDTMGFVIGDKKPDAPLRIFVSDALQALVNLEDLNKVLEAYSRDN